MAAASPEGFRDRELGQVVQVVMLLELLGTNVVGFLPKSDSSEL